MHTTGRMWTLNNSSQDFSIIKEMEVLKRGFPLPAILVKSNSVLRQNATTMLLLLKEKIFLCFLTLPYHQLCSHHAPVHWACCAPALSRKINTYFVHSLLLHDRHRNTQCIHCTAHWARVSYSWWMWKGRGQSKLSHWSFWQLPGTWEVAEAAFCHANGWKSQSQAGAGKLLSSEGWNGVESN